MGERLFHTLDPTTRAYRHQGRRYLVTDTVGFIRKLPHQLVEAFKATLEETVLADLIVHVVDASEPEEWRRESIAAVDSVLEEIGAGEAPRLVAFNKIDLLDAAEAHELTIREPDAIAISAATGQGLDELRDRIEEAFEETLRPVELLLPYSEGGALAELHELAGDLEREDRAEGVRRQGPHPRRAGPPVRGLCAKRPRAWARPERDRLEARSTLSAPWSSPSGCFGKAPGFPAAPTRATRASTCTPSEPATIGPGERASVGTGIAVEIPPGHAGLVLPRSGLAAEHGIALVNAPGLIDSGYRGEVRVLLLNTDRDSRVRGRSGGPNRAAPGDAGSPPPSRSRRSIWSS